MTRKTLLGIFALTFIGCQKEGWCDKKLPIPRSDYTGAEMRVDGVWITDIDSSTAGHEHRDCIVFYRNGVMNWLGSLAPDSIDHQLRNVGARSSFKPDWGIYRVTGQSLEMYGWERSQMRCYGRFDVRGILSSDSTFSVSGNGAYDNDYYFYQTQFKLDSTNDFID